MKLLVMGMLRVQFGLNFMPVFIANHFNYCYEVQSFYCFCILSLFVPLLLPRQGNRLPKVCYSSPLFGSLETAPVVRLPLAIKDFKVDWSLEIGV
jgi:hypothetical protein